MYSVSIRNIANSDGAEDQPGDVRADERAQPEDRERHQRVLATRLPDHEAAEQASAAAKRPIVSAEPQPYLFACVMA